MDITPAIFLVSFLCFAERYKLIVEEDRRVEAKLMTSPFCIPFFRSQWANVMFNDEDPMIDSSWNGAFLVSGKSSCQS